MAPQGFPGYSGWVQSTGDSRGSAKQSTRVDWEEKPGMPRARVQQAGQRDELGESALGEEPGMGPTGSLPRQSTRVDSPGKAVRAPRPVNREEYERAWVAYRNEPTAAAVQRELGCGADVAHRLLFEGLPVLGLPPMEKQLQLEARMAMAADKKLSRGTEKLTAEAVGKELALRREALKKSTQQVAVQLGDAVQQRAEEARLVRANRVGALALAGVTGRLLKVSNRLATMLDERVEEVEQLGLKGKAALDHLGLKPGGALELVKSISTTVVRAAQASEAAVRMERLLAGEPTEIFQHQGPGGGKPMSVEEQEQVMLEATRAFQRAKMRRESVEAEVVEVQRGNA
jgi:hypothetical protein